MPTPRGSPNDNAEQTRHGPREPSLNVSMQGFAVILVFTSIGALFLASIVALLVTRFESKALVGRASIALPAGLWLSTGFLICASVAFEAAWRAIRRNAYERLKRALLLGGSFAAAFLVGQAFNWRHMLANQAAFENGSLTLVSFYLLTGLHALHVVAGFVPLFWVLHRVKQRQYSSSRCQGIRFCVQYWHFLGIIWLVLLAVLYLTG